MQATARIAIEAIRDALEPYGGDNSGSRIEVATTHVLLAMRELRKALDRALVASSASASRGSSDGSKTRSEPSSQCLQADRLDADQDAIRSRLARAQEALDRLYKAADGEYEDARDAHGDAEHFGGAQVARRLREAAREAAREALAALKGEA